MKKLVVKDGSLRLRLLPPGKKRLPWLASTKTYPCIGYPAFWREMTVEERDKLYAVYQEGGLGALHDAVKFLDESVWINSRISRTKSSAERGRMLLEGR